MTYVRLRKPAAGAGRTTSGLPRAWRGAMPGGADALKVLSAAGGGAL